MIENSVKFQLEDNRIITGVNIDGKLYLDSKGKRPVFCKCLKDSDNDYNDKSLWDNISKQGYQFILSDGNVVCPHCERTLKVTETYESWLKEEQENLHIVRAGSDWECGLEFYSLSCTIDYDDWKLIKPYFSYYRRGWSRDKELEWYFGEPTGWLTTKGEIVEIILYRNGLIKKDNLVWFNPDCDVDVLVDKWFDELGSVELQERFDYTWDDGIKDVLLNCINRDGEGVLLVGTDCSVNLDGVTGNVVYALSCAWDNVLKNTI